MSNMNSISLIDKYMVKPVQFTDLCLRFRLVFRDTNFSILI